MHELGWAASSSGLEVVLHLGCETRPAWADEAMLGPLFAGHWHPESGERILGLLDVLIDQALTQATPRPLRIDWHLAERDFGSAEGRHRLRQLVQAAWRGSLVAFVCDRPRRPVILGKGLDRQHLAALSHVTLDLPALALRTGTGGSPEAFIGKLLSLVRLAVSAGVQKREFLRQHGRPERPAFLLDRAQLVLSLAGMDTILQGFFGNDAWQGPVLGFMQSLAERIDKVLAQETRTTHLRCVVSAPPLAPIASEIDWRAWLRFNGKIHALWGRGFAEIILSEEGTPDQAEIMELLHYAWKQTAVSQIVLQRMHTHTEQAEAGWKG
jgi:hypothetical protein